MLETGRKVYVQQSSLPFRRFDKDILQTHHAHFFFLSFRHFKQSLAMRGFQISLYTCNLRTYELKESSLKQLLMITSFSRSSKLNIIAFNTKKQPSITSFFSSLKKFSILDFIFLFLSDPQQKSFFMFLKSFLTND